MSSSRNNLVQKALDHLTGEILANRLRPNQSIREPEIAATLGISRSPVREALRILERDGLVVYRQGRGTFVADITPEDADELYLIHGHLMGLAVKLACQKMTGEDVTELEALVAGLAAAAEEDDRSGFLAVRSRVERFIASRSLSPRLARLIETMGYPCARYRSFHVAVPGYMSHVAEAYRGICMAFRSKDEASAEQLRVDIIDLGRSLLQRYFFEPLQGRAEPPAAGSPRGPYDGDADVKERARNG
ncbi:MAG: GntR family transcriptional regulator [Deltaproteobacteria bacterium]|nr:GntR family transcriptional regulator [Deltaproteobacteria bacterium]